MEGGGSQDIACPGLIPGDQVLLTCLSDSGAAGGAASVLHVAAGGFTVINRVGLDNSSYAWALLPLR
jgi:hypothetical protein